MQLALKLLIGFIFFSIFQMNEMKASPSSINQISNMPPADSVLRHVVMFNWKDSSTAEEIAAVESAFAALPNKISEIIDFEWGTNNSPEGLDKGFTHIFFVTFASEAGREVYLPHPDHQAFVKLIGPHVEDVLVLDYWTK